MPDIFEMAVDKFIGSLGATEKFGGFGFCSRDRYSSNFGGVSNGDLSTLNCNPSC